MCTGDPPNCWKGIQNIGKRSLNAPPPNKVRPGSPMATFTGIQVFNLSFSADRLEKINILRAAAFVSNCFDWQPLG